MYSLGYYRVNGKQTPEGWVRSGFCPRGFTQKCSECFHLRRALDETTFSCLDITMYEGFMRGSLDFDGDPALMFTYRDAIIGELQTIEFYDISMSMKEGFDRHPYLYHHFVQGFEYRISNGQITLQKHEDKTI